MSFSCNRAEEGVLPAGSPDRKVKEVYLVRGVGKGTIFMFLLFKYNLSNLHM